MFPRNFFRAILCIFFANISFSSAASEKLIPVEAFVERQTYSIPRLSPDGKHIAINVRIENNGRIKPSLTVYTLPELKVVSTIILPAYEIPVNFTWISNTRLVVNKGREVGDNEMPESNGEVLAVNFDGTKGEYLYGYLGFRQSSRGAQNGSDRGSAFVSHVPEARDGHVILKTQEWEGNHSMLYDINSMNSSRKLIADIAMKDLSFVHETGGKPRFAWGTDDNNLPALFKFDDEKKDWFRQENKLLGIKFNPLGFLPGDQNFLAIHSQKGEATSLVQEELVTGKRTKLIHDAFGDIGLIEYAAVSDQPFGVTIATGIPKTRYIDEKSQDAQLHKTLSSAFPQNYVHFINFSDDGNHLLFSVKSDRDPGSFYVFHRTTGKADLLFSNKPLIDPEQMADKRPIRFKARDGLEITGYLTMPKHTDGKRVPLILHPHGGPFGVNDTWYFDDDTQFLASRGYAVLQVNYRGSSGRGMNYVYAGYKEWGGKIIDDLIDGVKWANTQEGIDSERACTYGGSFGGYASFMLAIREPKLFKCAVGYAGIYDLASIYKQEKEKGSTKLTHYFEKTMGADPLELARISPSHHADQIKIPVMMVHGGKDKATELGQAEDMRDALIKSGNPPEWIYVKNEGHGFYDSEHRKDFYLKMETFLKKNLGQ